jgi:hypothetical protein
MLKRLFMLIVENRFNRYSLVLLCTFVFFLTQAASAHHPMSSQYSTVNQYVIEGVLKRVDISSPHSLFFVQIIDKNNATKLVKVEWGSGTTLNRYYAIDSHAVQTEQRIRVTGFLSNNPEDLMIWPTSIYTEMELSYDRKACNEFQKSGEPCLVLTNDPPLWPVLNGNFLRL